MLKVFEIIMLAMIVISVLGIYGDVKDVTYKHHIACCIAGVFVLLAEVVRYFIG